MGFFDIFKKSNFPEEYSIEDQKKIGDILFDYISSYLKKNDLLDKKFASNEFKEGKEYIIRVLPKNKKSKEENYLTLRIDYKKSKVFIIYDIKGKIKRSDFYVFELILVVGKSCRLNKDTMDILLIPLALSEIFRK